MVDAVFFGKMTFEPQETRTIFDFRSSGHGEAAPGRARLRQRQGYYPHGRQDGERSFHTQGRLRSGAGKRDHTIAPIASRVIGVSLLCRPFQITSEMTAGRRCRGLP